MLVFAFRRFLAAIPTLLILITVSFFIMRFAPGSPFSSEKKLPPEVQANIDAKYGFDKPIIVQFGRYLKGLVVDQDFGPSFKYRDRTVNELIAGGIGVSAKLALITFLLVVTIGVSYGMIAALFQNTFLDYTIMTFAMLGIVVPSFVFAPLLVLVFAINLDWFPAGGWHGGTGQYVVLPVLALSFYYIATISRITRASVLETLQSNFIRTAKAKGLPHSYILRKHVLRASLIPVISYLGPAFVGMLSGSMVIESVFGLPGLGRLFVDGALNRDYSLVLGLTIFVGFLTILFNAIVDILYTFIDPKISY